MRRLLAAVVIALSAGAAVADTSVMAFDIGAALARTTGVQIHATRPVARDNDLPRARWENRRDGELWTRVTLSAVKSHGVALLRTVPEDVDEWCPAYAENGPDERAAFWAGLLSALAKHESTWRPDAVGGGGKWFGLLQIYPQTAEFRDCNADSGAELKDAAANLNCAVRIIAATVPRDDAISVEDGHWMGVAADWGPIRDEGKRREMQRYTSRQSYCRSLSEVRPAPRP